MTKKQKQDAERARTLLQNHNIIVPQHVDGEKPKKPYYGKKKPPVKRATTDATGAEKTSEPSVVHAAKSTEPESTLEEGAKEEEVEDEEEEVLDDWEKIAEQDFTERKSPVTKEETRNASPLVDKLRAMEVKEAAATVEDESGESETGMIFIRSTIHCRVRVRDDGIGRRRYIVNGSNRHNHYDEGDKGGAVRASEGQDSREESEGRGQQGSEQSPLPGHLRPRPRRHRQDQDAGHGDFPIHFLSASSYKRSFSLRFDAHMYKTLKPEV